jgi:amino acid transporter
MLTFISFWRAAAIVLNDLGSSAFYAAGIAEAAVGKAAPWLILGVMVFAFCVRAVYVESCSMFVRGGVYRVVKEALGSNFAKISVSALVFDYILTGPISGVSAGQYIVGLLNQLIQLGDAHGWVPRALHNAQGAAPHLNENLFSVVFAVAMTLFYWWQNTKGLEESSEKALQVMKITTVMVVILLIWSGITLLRAPAGTFQLPPLPLPQNLHFSEDALGWLHGSSLPTTFGLFGIMIAFGHSVLAMSGEESLAQVNREIAHPKLLNLKKAAVVIGVFSFIFTGIGSLLAVMLIPDAERTTIYKDNLISGMAMHMAGPEVLKVIFQMFVVVVGFLILSGAINTSIIGSNGVLNRVSEDGVLTDWFRKPHKRFGTTYRIINMVTLMQLFTIIVSGGNVYRLGEAYAFGVIWSFTFNSFAMLVLRRKFKGERGWKVPPNIPLGNGKELPLGLLSVHLVLLTVAITNLFTKSIATKAGLAFTIGFFLVFTVSEKINKKKHAAHEREMKEHFQLEHEDKIDRQKVGIQPGNVLVTVRDYNTLEHLRWALSVTDTHEQDVVVLSARLMGPGASEFELNRDQIFSDYEQKLFTKAVSVAEGVGKTISLVVVPARDPFSAIVQMANNLESSAIVAGLSSKMTAEEQAFKLGQAWEAMPDPKRQIVFQVVKPNGDVATFRIGPHTPTMKTEDVHLVHRLWLRLKHHPGMDDLHHSDIVTLSLTRLSRDFSREPDEIVKALAKGGGTRIGTLPGARAALSPPRIGDAPGLPPRERKDKRPDSASDKDVKDDKDTFQGF